jgi:hypothetical protein
MKLFSGASGFSSGGPSYVMFPVMCQVCKYTLLFNAVAAGIVPRHGAATFSGEGTLTAGGTVSAGLSGEGTLGGAGTASPSAGGTGSAQ